MAKVIQDKGLYQLTTLDGKPIKTKHNGPNLKPYVRNGKQKTNSLSSLMPQTEFHNDDDGYKQLQCEQVHIVDICRSPSKAFLPTNNR